MWKCEKCDDSNLGQVICHHGGHDLGRGNHRGFHHGSIRTLGFHCVWLAYRGNGGLYDGGDSNLARDNLTPDRDGKVLAFKRQLNGQRPTMRGCFVESMEIPVLQGQLNRVRVRVRVILVLQGQLKRGNASVSY